MEFFQTTWRDGSAFNHGLTSQEYFYDQIYRALETNIKNKTLPFLSNNPGAVPIELTTGKIINDENLIALEQIAAKQGYKSNVWIYGDTLEKMQHEGISLNLRKGAEPALCCTKYANATHLSQDELYIAEGGAKTKAQFLYNYDSLDDRSKKAIDKYFEKAKKIDSVYSAENFNNYIKNIKNPEKDNHPLFQKLKESMNFAADKAKSKFQEGFENKLDKLPSFNALINLQARHICQVVTDSHVKSELPPNTENNCYSFFEKVVRGVQDSGAKPWKIGEAITNALDAGTVYAKTYTAEDFNLEVRKSREEEHQKTQKFGSRKSSGVSR